MILCALVLLFVSQEQHKRVIDLSAGLFITPHSKFFSYCFIVIIVFVLFIFHPLSAWHIFAANVLHRAHEAQ